MNRYEFIANVGTLVLAVLFLSAATPVAADLRSDFANPPLECKSRPLWFWNGSVDEAQTRAIMEGSKAMGYYGFGILPAHDREGFMSPEYLDAYEFTVKTASELGMKMCLYDEYWFPSGAAGGQLAEQYPEALSKRLDKVETEVTGPTAFSQPVPEGAFMGAVAMNTATLERINLTDRVKDGAVTWDVPEGTWKIMQFTCVRDGNAGLVDYLDPEAVAKFIALTYERYYKRLSKYFGTTIDSAFYDEPTLYRTEGARTWTPAFNAKFKERCGRNPVPYYPALWYDIGPGTAAARNALFGFRAELYAEGFVKTANEWCNAHGIQLTGHHDQEEVVNPTGICGDLIKSFKYQDMPGIDQIFQYGRASKAYKVVSSAAYNYDKRLVMTECYGAIKDMPVANLYKEAIDQFAKGINLMIPHAVWYDLEHVRFEPELSHRTEPYASALPAYNEFIGRLQRILQHGRHVADIGILYPIAALQAGYRFGVGEPYTGGIVPDEADYMDVGDMLALGVRRDFTFVHPEVLDGCNVAGATIKLNNKRNFEEYRVFVMPGATTIETSALGKLKQFYDQGGKIIATTCLPWKSAESGRDAQVQQTISELFGIDPTALREVSYPKATASSEWQGGGYKARRATDGNATTRWNAADGTSGDQWLEVDFGQPKTFSKTIVNEAFGRTRTHEVQYWDGKEWVACVTGTSLGTSKVDAFQPVTAAKVRLYIKEVASDSVSIIDFEVYGDDGIDLARPRIRDFGRENAAGGMTRFIAHPNAHALQAALDDLLAVYDVEFGPVPDLTNGNLSYIHKVVDGKHCYFIGNSSDTPIDTVVHLRGRLDLEVWDPHTGAMEPAGSESLKEAGQDVTRVQLVLSPVQSRFLVERGSSG